MRRLPVYLVVDISESMVGEPLRLLQKGMETLVAALRSDPFAMESVYLSVIGFAGRTKTLAPLVELPLFYPPRLPLGSGTSVGAAFSHLMTELKANTRQSTPQRKGDWQPLIFFLTDGKSTDNPGQAFARWQVEFAAKSSLVVVGIGEYASLEQFTPLTENILRLENTTAEDFMKCINWISSSIASQSRSVGLGRGGKQEKISLDKAGDSSLAIVNNLQQAAGVDEDFVILFGRCQRERLPWLIKYERAVGLQDGVFGAADYYRLSGIYTLEEDFIEFSDTTPSGLSVSSDMLDGVAGCPYCGAPSTLALCGKCEELFCFGGEEFAVCPHCNQELTAGDDDGYESFNITRKRG